MRKLTIILTLIMACVAGSMAQPGVLRREARAAYESGDIRKAVSLWDRIWQDSTMNPMSRFVAAQEAGEAEFSAGRYESGLQRLRSALAIGDSGVGGESVSRVRYNMALHLTSLGRYEDASEMLDAAGFTPGSRSFLLSRIHQAQLKSRKGNHYEAIEILDELLPQLSGEDSDIKLNRITARQNRGFIQLELGNSQAALADFKAALAETDKQEAWHYIILGNKALAEGMSGLCREAREDISAALAYFRTHGGENSYDYITALRKKAQISGMCGDARDASKVANQYLKEERKRIERELPDMSEQTRLSFWMQEKPALSALFGIADLDGETVLNAAILRRMVSMLGMRNSKELKRAINLDAREVARKLPFGSELLHIVEYADSAGERRYDALLLKKSGKVERIPLFTLSEIASRQSGESELTLYETVTSDEPEAINALYSDRGLSDMILLPILNRLNPTTSRLYFVAEGIFHLLGVENLPYTEGIQIRRISGENALQTTERDVAGRGGELLVAGGLDYGDSEEESSETEDENHNSYETLVRALGLTPGWEIFLPLPATGAESAKVAEILGTKSESRVYEGEFKKRAPKLRLLHLATHGYTLDSGMGEPPRFVADTIAIDMSLEYSGLALTGANKAGLNAGYGEDGILSAREIAGMDLSGVEMAVLSACQTARGEITDEGVSGLVRALKMAGVGTVVASLWEVDDMATRLFMESFYEGLSEGKERHDAFAEARKRVREHERRIRVRKFDAGKMRRVATGEERIDYPYAEPYYHSAFILVD